MDGSRFDDLARKLATRGTRRGFLTGLAGAVAGLAIPNRVAATCPPDQVKRARLGCVCKTTGRPPTNGGCPCASREYRCDGVCSKTPCACLSAVCPAPGVCRDERCCQPQTTCAADQCGQVEDGCGGTLDCGPCCAPVCGGNVCGDDGCGGVCGFCGLGQACSAEGVCACSPDLCPGCCDANEACQDGFAAAACGFGGGACDVCSDEGVCRSGVCQAGCGPACTGPGCACPPCQVCDPSGICRDVVCPPSVGTCSTLVCDPGLGEAGECASVRVADGTACAGVDGVCCGGVCVVGQATCSTVTCSGAADCGAGQSCCGGVCIEAVACQCITRDDCTALGVVGSRCSPVFCEAGLCVVDPRRAQNFDCDSGVPCQVGLCDFDGNRQPYGGEINCGALDTDCVEGYCDPATGGCRARIREERIGLSCDDGKQCTTGTICQTNGSCGGGVDTCGECATCIGVLCQPKSSDTACGSSGGCCAGVCCESPRICCGTICCLDEFCHSAVCSGP